MNVDLADRAAQIAARAKANQPAEPERLLTPKQERELHAAAEQARPVATWYRLTRHDQDTIDVAFNPQVTLQEARAWYPQCEVTP